MTAKQQSELYTRFLHCTLRDDQASKRYSEAMQHHLDATREAVRDEEKIARLLADKIAAKESVNGCQRRYSEAADAYYSFLALHKITDVIPLNYVPSEETAFLYLQAVEAVKKL